MPKKKKSDYAPHVAPETAPPCHIAGCPEAGAYKAPKSRETLHEYQWFCLDHIREHNQQWDYFAGFDSAEIESFIKDATTGHRPTWTRESRIREQYHQLQDVLYEFLNMGSHKPQPAAPTGKLRRALAVLDMQYPYNAQALKIQYRILVKKHHPDLNKGDKKSEELFKKVTAAYHTLNEHLKNH